MQLRLTLLAMLALSLTGCAASGKLYDAASWDADITQPNQARITVFRTTETLLAAGRDAKVSLNSTGESKYCAHGGYASFNSKAGKQVLSVELTPEQNRCEVPLTLLPGEEQFFEVKPNKDLIMSRAISAGFSAGLASNGVYGVGAGGSGQLPNCTSYFSLVPVAREEAVKLLVDIRESKQ